MLLRSSFVLISLVLLSSCGSDSPPPPVKSAEIQTEIIAKANGNGETVIEAVLQIRGEKGGVKDLEVELPFSIEAKVGNQIRKLYKTQRDGETVYTTNLPTDSVNEKYFVKSVKNNEESSNQFIILPQPFSITSAQNGNYDRDQEIHITWDNSKANGMIEAGFAMTCSGQEIPAVVILRKKVTDSGSLSINAAELVDNADMKVDTSKGCETMVILSRKTEKTLNPIFGEGSYSLGVQERKLHFSIKASNTTASL